MLDSAPSNKPCRPSFAVSALVAVGWARFTAKDDVTFEKQCASALLQMLIVYLLAGCKNA